MIYIYNTNVEDHSSHPNNFPIHRPYPLGNPYTHNGKRKSLAKLSFPTREEAIEAYDSYFDAMYGNDAVFTAYFDMIYEKYKKGEDIYLQCFCKPLPCHGDIIAKKLQQKLIKEYKMKKSDK